MATRKFSNWELFLYVTAWAVVVGVYVAFPPLATLLIVPLFAGTIGFLIGGRRWSFPVVVISFYVWLWLGAVIIPVLTLVS